MKFSARILLFLSISSILMVSCKKQRKDSLFKDVAIPATRDGSFVMQIGHTQTEASPCHRTLLMFKEQVETQTEGKITVEIFPNGIIGDETQMTEAVSAGKLEAVRGGDLKFLPKSMLLGLPMVADNLEEARKLCYSDFVKSMLSDAKSKNLMVIAVGDDSGFRQITNSERPIVAPADLKALQIGVPQISATINFFNNLGAETSIIPSPDLYAALAIGKVSAQENPLALIDSSKFYEVQKYCTIINYQFFPELMYVNFNWWRSIPLKYQKIIVECARAMMDENARITDAENEAYIAHMQSQGVKFTALTQEQRKAFEPYAERVWKDYVAKGYASKKDLTDMLAVVGKSVTW